MLLGLVGMGLFGIISLILINLYYNETGKDANASVAPAVTQEKCGTKC